MREREEGEGRKRERDRKKGKEGRKRKKERERGKGMERKKKRQEKRKEWWNTIQPLKRKEILPVVFLPVVTTWMNLDTVLLSEISKTQKDKYDFTYMWTLKKLNS